MWKLDILASLAAEAYEEEVRKKRAMENRATRTVVGNWGCALKRSEFHHRRSPKTISFADNDHPLSGLESKSKKILCLKFRMKLNEKFHIRDDDVSAKNEKSSGKTGKTGADPNFMTYIPSLNLPFKKRKPGDENCPNLLPESAADFTSKKRKIGFHHKQATEIPTLNPNETPKIKKVKSCDDPNPPPDLPVEFRNRILERAGSREVGKEVLVIQKRLTQTDLQDYQNRFSIPEKQVKNKFLTPEAEVLLKQRSDNGHCKVLNVEIIEPQDRVNSVNLARWEMKKEQGNSSVSYVLNGDGWKHIRDGNKLQVGNLVQLWSVPIEGKPCFIFVKLGQQ